MKKQNYFKRFKVNIAKKIKGSYFVEKTSRYAIFIYISILNIAGLIAFLFGNRDFLFFENLVSHLGYHAYTPLPFIFNLGCIITGLLLIPFFFYLLERINKSLVVAEKNLKYSRFFKFFSHSAFYSGLIGSIGFIGIGVFSMNWNPFFMHEIFATLVLTGFIFLAFFMSWLIVIYDLEISINLGIYGIISSVFILVTYLTLNTMVIFDFRFLEWIWMLIIISWLSLFIRSVFKDSDIFLVKNLLKYKKNLYKNRIEIKEAQ